MLTAASTFAGLSVFGFSEDSNDMTLISFATREVGFVKNGVSRKKKENLELLLRQQTNNELTIDSTECTGSHRSPASSYPY